VRPFQHFKKGIYLDKLATRSKLRSVCEKDTTKHALSLELMAIATNLDSCCKRRRREAHSPISILRRGLFSQLRLKAMKKMLMDLQMCVFAQH